MTDRRLLPASNDSNRPTLASPSPGPWRIERDTREGMEFIKRVVDANGREVCTMASDHTPNNLQGEADARLIVSATRDTAKKQRSR